MDVERQSSRNGDNALPLGEAHARAILDAALDAVITIDHRGYVLEFNRAAELTFGYRKADVVGLELAALIVPPEFREAHRAALSRWDEPRQASEEGVLLSRRMEVPAMRSDGSTFPAEVAVGRVDAPGSPIFTACVRDLSEARAAEERLQRAEFHYRTLVEQLPLITYVDSPESPLSKPSYLSPQVESIHGVTVDEWLATPGLFENLIHDDDRERVLALKHAAYEQGKPLRIEYRMYKKDGSVIWVEDQSVHIEAPDGEPAFRQGFALDITERKHADDALRAVEAHYRTLVEQLPLAVYIDRIDAESSCIYVSPQIESMVGYPAEQWIANPSLFVEVLHPDDRERVLAAHQSTHETGEPLKLEYRLCKKDGTCVWVHDEGMVVADGDEGKPVLQGYLLDVTSRKEVEDALRHQAFHDPLTGLANRALFVDRVEHALVLRGEHSGAAVLFLDVDDFKAVNDRLGHQAGDATLQAVAARLRDSLSPSYTVARMGGDEFAVLVEEEAGEPAAVDVAEWIISALAEPFEVDEREVLVSVSVGIAVGGNAEELLRAADVAMHRAKASGKAQYVIYVPMMDDDVVGRLELVADLRRAHERDEFVVHYQPIVELATGTIVGVEALIRWDHPTRGFVQPLEFIALAEETGSIVDIGRWVLAEACRSTARLRADVPGAESLSVSVNVSARQVRRPTLFDDVVRALADSGLPPEALTLEITESVLARRREEMTSILEEVTALGVRLALDDFGTGYSSLSLLQDLPVHTLKIDRSFVQTVATGPSRRAFVRAMVDIADALDLNIVAEGIEETSQVAELLQLGCRIGQGFHFSRPLPPVALEAFVRRGALAAA